jgi:hypothetical protein
MWLLVVATGPLHSGQFTITVSMSGHWGITVRLVTTLSPKNVHHSRWTKPRGAGAGSWWVITIGSRMGMKTYSPGWRSSSEWGTRLTSSAVVGGMEGVCLNFTASAGKSYVDNPPSNTMTGMTGTIETLAAWALTTLVSAFVGSYIGSYLKKKGEDRATREGFKNVRAELAETTRVTKEIERKISQEMWNEQRLWELKKEAIFSMMQAVGVVDDKIVALDAAYFATSTPPDRIEADSIHRKRDALYEALNDFSKKRSMAVLVCDPELMDHLSQVGKLVRRIASDLQQNKEISEEAYQQLRSLYSRAFDLARRELRVPEKKGDSVISSPQSSGSSARG